MLLRAPLTGCGQRGGVRQWCPRPRSVARAPARRPAAALQSGGSQDSGGEEQEQVRPQHDDPGAGRRGARSDPAAAAAHDSGHTEAQEQPSQPSGFWVQLLTGMNSGWPQAQQLVCVALASVLLLSAALPGPPPAHAAASTITPTAVILVQESPSPSTSGRFGSRFALASAGNPQQQQQQQEQQRSAFDWKFDQSSEMEDSLLEAARQVTARLDSAFDVISSGLDGRSSGEGSEEVQQAAETLINEVFAVVDSSYMDARQAGFDRSKWGELRDKALARQYKDIGAVHRAVRDMVARGLPDPYCRWVPPSEFAAMKKYDVTGVGLNLGTAEEYVKKTGRTLPTGASGPDVWVVGISRGSPADVAGVEQGDQLVSVSGRRLEGSTPFQASALIAGPQEETPEASAAAAGGSDSSSDGSQQQQQKGDASAAAAEASSGSTPPEVVLTVRKADGRLHEYRVPRPVVTVASPVRSSLQVRAGGRKVGVVSIKSFTARAQRDVAAAIADLEARGAQELELDLRDNRGGLVTEGLEVARLFLEGGVPIVVTESKAMAAAPPTADGPPLTRLPLTVLVNDHTASASEILAGALKDNCRAVLVGGRTYGKGLIQSVYELSDTSGLVITVGKYITPSGIDIDRFGIEPDFKNPPSGGKAAAALDACRIERGRGGEILVPAGVDATGRGPQELLVTGETRSSGGGSGRQQ